MLFEVVGLLSLLRWNNLHFSIPRIVIGVVGHGRAWQTVAYMYSFVYYLRCHLQLLPVNLRSFI